MTDDISKVVPPEAVQVKDDALNFGVVQAKDWVIPTACGVRVVDERMAYGWNECRKATIDRLESAAAPVEVEEDWQLIDGHRSPDGMTYTATYWCANTGALKTETTSDGRFRAGEGPRIRRPTLARQLAEAKAENAIATSVHEHERLNLMSQLAAATRRLGEVEGLVGKWRDEATGQSGYWVDALRDCAAELESALKEPK